MIDGQQEDDPNLDKVLLLPQLVLCRKQGRSLVELLR